MSMIGIGAFPLAILITGCTMMDLVGAEKPSWRVVVGASIVRLALAPLVILSAAKFFPLTAELRQVLVVQAAMPAGMSAIMLARMYGGRPAVAVQVVIATTVVSLLTLPWIITWGSEWIGLAPLPP
jgi:predicted permease